MHEDENVKHMALAMINPHHKLCKWCHTVTNKQVSYTTEAFVFDVKELLCELHMQKVLEN